MHDTENNPTTSTGFSVRSDASSFKIGTTTEFMDYRGLFMGYRGFKMTFANGYTISVQFGTLNYCDAYEDKPIPFSSDQEKREWLEKKCANAEIAVFDANNNLVTFKDGHQVRGHTSPDVLADIIAWAVAQPALK